MKNLFPSNLFMWDVKTKTASAELSEMAGAGFFYEPDCNTVSIQSQKTGIIKDFRYDRYDTDASGEDIYGSVYESTINGDVWTVLIISD